jgi:putative Holliday junction resolvase
MTAMSVLAAKGHDEPAGQAVPTQSAPRILAVDYGRRRIGLAVSDELGLTAQPLAILVRRNRQDDLKRLREICRSNSVGHIVVGYPLHITGEASEMAAEAAQFAARLAKALGIETELVDERLTSWEARQTVAETATRRRGQRSQIDDVAAAVLLREYLEHRRERPRAFEAEQG